MGTVSGFPPYFIRAGESIIGEVVYNWHVARCSCCPWVVAWCPCEVSRLDEGRSCNLALPLLHRVVGQQAAVRGARDDAKVDVGGGRHIAVGRCSHVAVGRCSHVAVGRCSHVAVGRGCHLTVARGRHEVVGGGHPLAIGGQTRRLHFNFRGPGGGEVVVDRGRGQGVDRGRSAGLRILPLHLHLKRPTL